MKFENSPQISLIYMIYLQVKIWFQNRRTKFKKCSSTPTSSSNQQFQPKIDQIESDVEKTLENSHMECSRIPPLPERCILSSSVEFNEKPSKSSVSQPNFHRSNFRFSASDSSKNPSNLIADGNSSAMDFDSEKAFYRIFL